MYTLLALVVLPAVIQSRTRIIGGSPESIANVPYQLSFRRHGTHICGAAILSTKIAITAAHCIPAPAPYSIKAGITNLKDDGVVIHVEKVLVHPYYSDATTDYDIALLFLASPLTFNDNIKPVALPKDGNTIRDGMVGKISGWGTTSRAVKDKHSDRLYSVDLPAITWRRCNYIYFRLITERMFCVGLVEGGKDSCSGDSGGPFVVDGVLYGLVSGGMDCAQPGFPGIYTNVQVLRAFIRDNAGV